MDNKETRNEHEEALGLIRTDTEKVKTGAKAFQTMNPEVDLESSEEASGFGRQYDERNALYTDLLRNHVNNSKEKEKKNRKYKAVFFWVTLGIMAVCVVVPLGLLVTLCFMDKDLEEDLTIVIGGAASILSALIILPKIIAEHLFPTNEDENMIGMVKEMQKNDAEIRKNHQGIRDDSQEKEQKNN